LLAIVYCTPTNTANISCYLLQAQIIEHSMNIWLRDGPTPANASGVAKARMAPSEKRGKPMSKIKERRGG
jgi:hypothetical protein